MVRLLALKVSDALIELVNLVLGALADGALSFSIVCAFPRELFGSEVGYAAWVRSCTALLAGLAVRLLVAVPDGRPRLRSSRVGRGRHAEMG